MYNKYENNTQFRRPFRAPVNVGEVYDVTIEAKGEKGDGLAKKDGFVIFVPSVEVGDKVKIKINKVLKNVAFGEKVDNNDEAQISEDVPEKTQKLEESSKEESNKDDSYEDSEDF